MERIGDSRTPARGTLAYTARWLLWLSGAILLAGCSAYHRAYRPANAPPTEPGTPELHFVEADDEGWFWEPKQALGATAAVERAAEQGDTLVVTFVHGWHHSARCCNGNLEGFKKVLDRLQFELGQPMYQGVRNVIRKKSPESDIPPIKIVGVYVGWRGRALPGLFDYLTFWSRKSAAERVGETDFHEFMMRLRKIYDQRTSLENPKKPPSEPNLFGMVTIGHSFGGQVVLRATSAYLEHQLEAVVDTPGYLRQPTPQSPLATLHDPVTGFGDLVVLINPAVEAAAYQRLHALSQLNFDKRQVPLMLTISADNDGPRHTLFPLGRNVGAFFTGKARIADDRERSLERTALGIESEQVTHRIEPVDANVKLVGGKQQGKPESYCTEKGKCEFDWYDWKEGSARLHEEDSLSSREPSVPVVEKIGAHDFSSRTVFSDVVLEPLQTPLPHQAFIVASASPKVIDGHNGMFSRPLMDFLTKYIGFTEAKKFYPVLRAVVDAQAGQPGASP